MAMPPSPSSTGMADTKATNDRAQAEIEQEEPLPQHPSMLKRLWLMTGLDALTIILMIKGALPAVIILAAYRADAFAAEYTTLGYLAAIMGTLALAIQPRGKYVQNILTSVIFVCLGAAVSLLQIQCTVSARQMTERASGRLVVGSSGSSQTVEFNAAASTVSGVWLFITIFVASTARTKRPALQLPVIQYSIFTVVASTYAPQFPNMAAGESFTRRLLLSFLTGFGVATGCALFIFPITSRKVVKGQMASAFRLQKEIITEIGTYLHNVSQHPYNDNDTKQACEISASKLESLAESAGQIYGKMKLEIGFAKKELAFGKWQPHDFSAALGKIRAILLPSMSLCEFLRIMQTAREQKDEENFDASLKTTFNAASHLGVDDWNYVMKLSHEPIHQLKQALVDGIDHICLTLEITPKSKRKSQDVEQNGKSAPKPGNASFAMYLQNELKAFNKHRGTVIRRWCDSKNIELPASFWTDQDSQIDLRTVPSIEGKQHDYQQVLYLLLYIEFMVASVAESILDMVVYADSKVADGTMKRRHFVNPGWRRIRKLFWSIYHSSDGEGAVEDGPNSGAEVWVGDSLKARKDPEHLPPATVFQRITNYIRAIPRFLSSPEAAFGLRASVATLSIGILAFLRQTYAFFLQQRGLWALIMVAISMSPQSGQGTFAFAARLVGTAIAMALSICIWYIGDKQPAAIVPVFFIYMMGWFYFLIKHPRYSMVGVVASVTGVLIIGYELQAVKLGLAVTESNGQEFYPIYLLAPYRLASVAIGLGAAFFWTQFPYPVTSHGSLRKDVGKALYTLANYYSVVHTEVGVKLRHGASVKNHLRDKKSPMARLDKANNRCMQAMVLLIARMKEQSHFSKFEFTLGGRFPRQKYDNLISAIQHISQLLTLLSFSADVFIADSEEKESVWLRDFRAMAANVEITSQEITSILCLLAASMSNAQPLPPYIAIPKPIAIAQNLQDIDPGILSTQHVAEPCYAAFAVLEVASTLVTEELGAVVKMVQDLVGEVDFSFHVVSAAEDSGSTNGTTLWEGADSASGSGSGKGKKE